MNLLTRIPSAERMATPGAWDENDRLRREASAVIARAAHFAGAGRLVQESLAFVYADGGDAWLDQDAPVAGGSTTSTALIAEANARELVADTVVLRFGLSRPDSGLTLSDLEAARAGVSPSLGRRDALIAARDCNGSVVSCAVDGGRIARIDVVRNPDKLRRVATGPP